MWQWGGLAGSRLLLIGRLTAQLSRRLMLQSSPQLPLVSTPLKLYPEGSYHQREQEADRRDDPVREVGPAPILRNPIGLQSRVRIYVEQALDKKPNGSTQGD